MTREKAEAKAAALTATGTPTRVRKDARMPGGWRTVTVAVLKKAHAAYRASDARQARDARYNGSEKARAANARAKLGYNHGKTRLNEEGTRFAEADLLELRRRQRGKCFVCGRSLRGRRNGQKIEAVEHDHGTGFVRSLSCIYPCNVLLACIEKLRIPIHELHLFITRVQAALWMPWLGMSEAEIRRARRRARVHVDAKEA